MTNTGKSERCLSKNEQQRGERNDSEKHEVAQTLSQNYNIHPRQSVESKVDVQTSTTQIQEAKVGDQKTDVNTSLNSGGTSLSEKNVYQDNLQVAPIFGGESVKEGTSGSLCAPGVLCIGFSHQEESEKYRRMQQTQANCQGLEIVGHQFERLMAAGLTEMAKTYARTHMIAASSSCITTGGGGLEVGEQR